jgi:hypothetical protein
MAPAYGTGKKNSLTRRKVAREFFYPYYRKYWKGKGLLN